MKNIYLLLLIIFFCACRKDNSTFENNSNSSSSNGKNCLIIEEADDASMVKTTVTYQLDSILASYTNSAEPSENFYLIQETPTKFIYTEVTNELKNAKYRVYLNSFGAIDKEVEIALNADGKTFTESAVNKNTYVYNSKQQLISVVNNLEDENLKIELLYDDKNRIKEAIFKDEFGMIEFSYTNFKYLPNAKNDNHFIFYPVETVGAYFIPSLRNVYISHFELITDDIGLVPDNFDFEYNFKSGSLNTLKGSFEVFTVPIEFTYTYKLSCK